MDNRNNNVKRVRRTDGMAERIQHAQYRSDVARLRNECSLENEEKVAEDDGSFADPGTVEFVRNGSEGGDLEAGAVEEEEVSIVQAVLIENPSDEELSVEELPLAEATALLPLYRQKHVWFVAVVAIGIIVAMIIILPNTGDQKTAPPAPTTAIPSSIPSFLPTRLPSAMPSMTQEPSGIPSYTPTSIEDYQCSVLLQFYSLFGGENWTVSNGWSPSSGNMCGWNGVECDIDDFAKVKELALPANNLRGNIEDLASLMNGLMYLEGLDLDSNLIVGSWTALGSNLVLSSSLAHVDLRLNELTGSVTLELCESIGGGIFHVDCEIECECCNHEELCEVGCGDVPGWHDSDGEEYDCTWYRDDSVDDYFYYDNYDRCAVAGSYFENEGHTANTACCVCGGGTELIINMLPSSAPSTTPTLQPSISAQPSLQPSLSQQPSISTQPSLQTSPQPTQQPSISAHPSSQYQLQQRDALVALYNATDGDGWHDNTNWLSDESICEWYGVTCNNDGHVDIIVLIYNSLQGMIPTELGLLANLQLLGVYDNSLQGTIPTEFGLLTSLQRLYVSYNYLQGTIPTELGLLTSLQLLDVSFNSLQGMIPTELGLLTSLQLLDVSFNSLQGVIPTELGLLMSLQLLDVYYNSLQGTIPTELGLLMSLQYLFVDDNSITGAVPNEVCALRDINGGKLRYLWVDCEEVECTCCTYCY